MTFLQARRGGGGGGGGGETIRLLTVTLRTAHPSISKLDLCLVLIY